MLDGNLPRMSYSPSEIDANFYRLIHKMVAQDQEEETRERRGATRRPLRSMQRIAPCRGPGLPKEDEFFMARCYDLTRAGFSFLVPSRPDYEALVAALGDPPELIYVAAEVLHCRSVLLHRSGAVQHPADMRDPGRGRGTSGEFQTSVRKPVIQAIDVVRL